MMTPEPEPAADALSTSSVTTLGSTFAAIAVACTTSSVLFTVTVEGPAAGLVAWFDHRALPIAVPPRPAAPPTRAAATRIAVIFPAPTRPRSASGAGGFVSSGWGTVGWACVCGCAAGYP